MRSSFLSIANRASLALFAAAMLAACDTDRPFSPAPKSTALPSSPSSALYPGGRGNLFLTAVHPDMTTIPTLGSSFNVIQPTGDTIKVVDNGQYDSDPSAGVIKLSQFLAGKYTSCPLTAPTGFDLAQDICVTTTVAAGSGASLGFISFPKPSLWWTVARPTGELIGGGVYSVVGLHGLVKFTVADNGANDLDSRPGFVNAKITLTGTYSVCEVTPPPTSFPAMTKCFSVNNSVGKAMWVGQFTNQEQQVIYIP